MKRSFFFSLALGCAVVAALALAPAASAVPACWQIDGGQCAVFCWPASCSSWSVGACSGGAATYHFQCSGGSSLSAPCNCDDGGGGGSCFLAGTGIRLADGTSKPVEEIVAGDLLLAYDEATGELMPEAVRGVHEGLTSNHHLVLNGELRLTWSHPVLSGGEWIEVGRLQVGDTLTTADGIPLAIESRQVVPGPVEVFNFEVDPLGTYVAGGVVVHNKKLPVKEVEPEEGP
jgi:hypothetical protein